MPDTTDGQEKPTIPTPAIETSGTGDVENPAPAAVGAGVSNIIGRWRREDLRRKLSLGLRGVGLVCSLLSFIIMASNQHGDGKSFDEYEEYRYVLAIAILSSLYTGLQVFRQVHELSTGREAFSSRRQNVAIYDFFGDQVVAYLLISAASSAVPLTDRVRESADNIFTDSSASAISMEFLAFFALALSALISGYKLANQTYI
ncbi:unnamed protein product [Coffea canephora]|uniref:CASP-like protein n=1 Tax=Coffea canephora TaxID=49390 RepID=A0A068VGH8_COFCA|nr:unnamed protein product [Coffea canephora]